MRLYHFVPEGGVVGDTLLPLSTLRLTLPEVYAKAEEKYDNREHVPHNRIPLLECHWEDTIFLSPVHPQVLHGVLVSCGHSGLIGRKAFAIDHTFLDPTQLVVYEFEEGGSYSRYDDALRLRYARISEATKRFYRDAVTAGRRPFIFAGVTHVMYRGEIPIMELPTVQVRE